MNALKSEVATMVTDKLITASVKDFAQDKDYLNAFIVALASKWSIAEPIVISTADAESLKKYFAAHPKALLDKGVTIQQVNGIKTLFTVSPADGSYKVNLGEEDVYKRQVSAWSAVNGISLGQVKVDDKSNEITAIPLLINSLELSGCIAVSYTHLDVYKRQTDGYQSS